MEDRIVAGRQGSSGIATRPFDDLYQMGSFFSCYQHEISAYVGH